MPMQPAPLVSVIMPVYNSGMFLAEAVESILSQSLKSFELLAVYDSSKDDSLAILERFQACDDRVRIVHGDGKGLPAALNQGLDTARGRYIARMDADDISLPTRFEKQIRLMEEIGADICGCHFTVINGAGRPTQGKILPLSFSAFVLNLACTVPFAHGSVMINAEFLRNGNFRYSNMRSSEDYKLWVELFEARATFANVDEILFKYRDTGGSLSKRVSKENADASRKIRREYVLGNREAFLAAIEAQLERYDALGVDEKKYLLMGSYMASICLKRLTFFSVLKRSSPDAIFLFILNWFRGI